MGAAELETEPWTLLFDRGVSIDEATTRQWMTSADDVELPEPQMFATPCVGPIAFTRSAFDAVGGFDDRFEGWAYEDVDLWFRFQRDVPRSRSQAYPGTALVQFWHPVDHHDLTMDNPNVRLSAETWG